MKCPHCTIGINETWKQITTLGKDPEADDWIIMQMTCPECKRHIVRIDPVRDGMQHLQIVHPIAAARAPLSHDVPETYADDYREACLVLVYSPKASAALSRRCLQSLLRGEGRAPHVNLSDEIDHVMPSLPSHLQESIDAIRTVGNFASHPSKNTNTGEIVKVEPGEADWLLDVLEDLFDFYLIAPARAKRKRDDLNIKLKNAGKPELKSPPPSSQP